MLAMMEVRMVLVKFNHNDGPNSLNSLSESVLIRYCENYIRKKELLKFFIFHCMCVVAKESHWKNIK